jgi:diguanylate cyclase
MIVKDLFVNISILTSLLFLYSQLTKNNPLNRHSTLIRKITVGFLGGLLGIILMLFSMHVGDVIVDLRHIPIILLAFYAGAIPAYFSMSLIILGRFLIGINTAAYLAVPVMLLTAIGAIYLSRRNLTGKMKAILSLSWTNLMASIIMCILIKELETLLATIVAYWVVSFLGGGIAFYIINYLRFTQELFEKYRNESTIDGLTGLNNYRKFDDIYNSIIQTINEKGEKLSLLFIDIDFFKNINDKFGHSQGDEVLKQLGDLLKARTRSFDIVSRNGGEEFTILILDGSLEKARETAENIRKSVEEYPFQLAMEKIHITVSIGISCYNETTTSVSQIIDDADKALYEAKKSGRNKVCIANFSAAS